MGSCEVISKPVLNRVPRDDNRGENQRHVLASLLRQVLRVARHLPEIVGVGLLHRSLEAPEAAVVRGEHEVPVAVEHLVQRLQVFGGRDGGFFRIRSLIDEPVVFQAVFNGGGLHELPRTLGARLGHRVGLEAALDNRNVREIERQPFRAEHVLDHREILRAPCKALGDVVAQASPEQLDIGEHPLVFRNRNVVEVGGEIFPDRLGGRLVGGRPGEGRDLQQLVDCRGFVLLFDEAVALREGQHFEGVDPIDQPIEMLPQPRIGPGPVGRFEQHVHRPIEVAARALEVAHLQLTLAGFEVLL